MKVFLATHSYKKLVIVTKVNTRFTIRGDLNNMFIVGWGFRT